MFLLRRYRVGLVLLGLLVAVGFLVVYRLKDQQARAVTRPRPDVLVGVVTPERRTMEIKLAFTADIVPAKQAAIFSKVSGYIRRIHADRGDFVEAGQVLVEIDDLELQASSDQAQAMVGSSQAGLEMARSTLEGNRANIENQRANLAKARAVADNDARQALRMKTLFERGLVSATDWENARTNSESSQANGIQNGAAGPDAGSVTAAMGNHVEPVSVIPVRNVGELPAMNPELERAQPDMGGTELFRRWAAHGVGRTVSSAVRPTCRAPSPDPGPPSPLLRA